MANINCEVIEDLLPIYVENMASPSSRELVEEHLATCEGCRLKEASMHGEMQLPPDTETKAISGISRRLFRKKVTVVVMTLLIILLLAVLCVVHLNSPIVIPYEDIEDSVQVDVSEDNRVFITMDNLGGSSESEYSVGEDGSGVQFISLYTTRLKQLMKMTAGTSTFEVNRDGDRTTEGRSIRRVYYYPSAENGEAVCLYEDETAAVSSSQGVVVLPRLVLNYYMVFAVILSLVGILVCVICRKQEKKFFPALKVTLIPVMYLVSSLIVLWNKDDIYNAQYYFTGILMAAFVLYLMGYWLVDFLRYYGLNKKN